MKRALTACTLASAMLAPRAGAVDFIRQIQLIEGQTIVYDVPVANTTGEIRSKPIEGTGAIFQLYAYEDPIYSPFTLLDATVGDAVHANVGLGQNLVQASVGDLVNAKVSLTSNLVDLNVLGIHLNIVIGSDPAGTSSLPHLLAEKAVGAYIPEAVVTLGSADAYFPPRTRADQPYQAKIAIGRLPAEGAQVPQGVPKKVRLDKSYKLYHPTLHIPADNGSGQGSYDQSLEFTLNGTYSMPVLYQNLPGGSPTHAIGEETFSASVRLGTDNKLAKIGSATIQIWPVATAEIQNIESGKRYASIPQNVQAVLTDLYPDSVTYAQIYKGPPELGKSGHKIPSSVFSINTFAPQNTIVPIQDLEDGITDDGLYTIEVLTVTPFNHRQPERVTYTTLDIRRTIEVRATMATME